VDREVSRDVQNTVEISSDICWHGPAPRMTGHENATHVDQQVDGAIANAAHVRGEDSLQLDDEFGMLPASMRIAGTTCRMRYVLSAWVAVLAVSKTLSGAYMRARARYERGCATRTVDAWMDRVEWHKSARKAAARVQRRQGRLCRAAAISAWRHVVHWEVRWRSIAPCIQRRWRSCVLREVIYCWYATAQRFRNRSTATKAFQRRRNSYLIHEYLIEWSDCASLVAMRRKVLETAQSRGRAAAVRAVLRCWGDLRDHMAFRVHADTLVRRRRALSLLFDAYHRWSDWSYTCGHRRKAALRAFGRMRASAASSHHCNALWQRLSAKWIELASAEIKGVNSRLRGHLTLALSQGMASSITKLLRSTLRGSVAPPSFTSPSFLPCSSFPSLGPRATPAHDTVLLSCKLLRLRRLPLYRRLQLMFTEWPFVFSTAFLPTEWSLVRRKAIRKKDALARALRRRRVRTCTAVLEGWNALLDYKSFLHLVHTRIARRRLAALLHINVMLWRECSLMSRRFRLRFHRLKRRVLLRFSSRIIRLWQVDHVVPS
jgi:hypothetical protein